MLAGARGPDLLGSKPPWTRSAAANDIQDKGICHSQQGGEHRQQTSSKRSCFFGLETKPELVWEDWNLGKEFTKTLVLKNIDSKLQKLNLRPPVSKFFTTSTPQKIVISPGTSFSIPVSFRPLQKCEYEDSIEFQGKDGSFQVYLRALIPHHALEVPDSVKLSICAVQHSSHTTFRLKNASKLHTSFQWLCAAPFHVSPEQGLLKPSQECRITVAFQPQEALVYQQQAYCWFGEGDKLENYCTVLLQGLAKYPCLQIRNPVTTELKEQEGPVLHFGSVAVGQSLQKHFEIFNPSSVTASFSLSRLSDEVPLFGSEFSCDVTSGKVEPGESQWVAVNYSPAVVDTVSVEYLRLTCRGALNDTVLKLSGTCIGPKVTLSSSVVDFGCAEEGGAVIQTVELLNSSPAEAFYQWDLDCNGHSVFRIQPASGTVHPHSKTALTAVYRPTQPIAHHRRVACLILHMDPLFLDMIGTCHSELEKPAILRPEHLILYKLNWYRSQHPLDTLSVMQQEHNVHLDQQRIHSVLEESNQKIRQPQTPMEEFYHSYLGCMDPLSSSSSFPSPHVSVVPSELLFNHKMSSSMSTSSTSSQFICLTNHTRGKLRLVWTVAQDSSFTVSPTSCDLAPLKTTSFRVMYDPKQLNSVHGAQLECFAYYKDSHHIGEQLLCVPWCVTVRVTGHSFQPGKEHFIPCCSLMPPRVVFPALSVLSYQTVLLQNDGDLPLTFFLDHSSNPILAESVCVIPNSGLIQPGAHQILSLRTTPTEDSPKHGFRLQLQLNAAKHTKELTIVSVVEKLRVSLDGDSSLYFQPTAVGSQTQCSHNIRNLSHVPLRFQWCIPESDLEIIFVDPDAGELHPNESSMQTWSFRPLAEKTYTVNPTLTFWPIQTDGSNRSHISLKVVGMGSKVFIKALKAVVDVGETLVGSYRSVEIPLVNSSPCPVSFCLSVQQILLEEDLIYDPETEPSGLQLDCEKGTIPSHCTMLLRSTVKPQRQAQYLWTISYQTLNAIGVVSSPLQAVCEVRAKGVFPTLQVIDVCSGDSGGGRLSKVHLWKLFSLDNLNKHLLCNPSSAELTYRTPTRHSLRSCPSIFTKTMLDFNFSAAPLNSDPSTFVLIFHNPGYIPVDWAFLFPEDQQIELEYWADTGEFRNNDLNHMKVQDNHLFSVSPRSGTLQRGQQRAVHFSYSHDFAGTDRFPVVFKLSYGREILLNFQGVTVERDRPYLHFASNRHVFTSVTIGECSPPRQMYELHNAGAVPVHYEVDTAMLSQLQVDNFNHPLLCCLNPKGEVRPGKTAMMEWLFSPLEAKMYYMDILIHIQDGDSTLVTFEGCGLVTPTLGSPNPFSCSDSKAPVPCVHMMPFSGQVVFLSEDSLSLGDILVNHQFSRIFFLTNVSQSDIVHYKWDLPQQSNQQVVQVHPEQGSLCPEECALCILTFTSTDYPTVYQLDLICQVTKEAAMVQYHDALKRWEEERACQQNEFTITDRKPTKSQGVLMDQALPVRKGPPLRKYKTLPPICGSSSAKRMGTLCNKLTRAERWAEQETATVWSQPEPPLPTLLHLWVTAHSHRPLKDLTHFPDQFKKINRNIHDDSAFIQSANALVSDPITSQPAEPSLSHCPSSPFFLHPLVPRTSSSSPELQLTRPKLGLNEEHNTVGVEGAACLEIRPRTQSTEHTKHVPANISETVLLNTLQNLMMEAVRGELNLTGHPRNVILPRVSTK
ncbi:cilia- and flagella-associated protein 65 isoform X2 [Mastacembelus armatus]|uniref:cilia- and flagella-associated protein 65 isoform X2 n=1 Tax=Mastacembelus armatus TaxID=205130 RepID=UPI000E454246|nr:cilia- and flagella-associated protein 65 isoform X2 [Mastacembelus armatus]